MWIPELIAVFFVLEFQEIKSLPRRSKLTSLQSEWSDYHLKDVSGPGTYLFGYDVEDTETNNVQFRNEERHFNGTVTGSYGYMQPDGNILIVHYTADNKGYRAKMEDSKKSMLKNPSPEMVAAMDAIKMFKKQKKYEQRERPVDVLQMVVPASSTELETKSTVVFKSSTTTTTATPLRRVVASNNKAHAYFYFPHRKENLVS